MHEDGGHGPVIVHNHSLGTTRTRGMGPGGSRDVDVKYVRGSSYAGTDRDRQAGQRESLFRPGYLDTLLRMYVKTELTTMEMGKGQRTTDKDNAEKSETSKDSVPRRKDSRNESLDLLGVALSNSF